MAQSRSLMSEDQFLCSICLDVFTNPVSTPCGHSFCMTCIGDYWDSSKACQCPLCKESFRKRPELHINRTLREITEQFKRMSGGVAGGVFGGEATDASAGGVGGAMADRPPRLGELPGDLFAEMKQRFQRPVADDSTASASAPSPECPAPGPSPAPLVPAPPCPPLASRRYTLSGPADSLDAPQCVRHHQRLELFCRTDQTCVCTECTETEHRSHTIIPAKREWLIKKSQLGITEVELQGMIRDRERKVQEIRASMEDIRTAAERETEGSVQMFSSLVSSMERSQAELLELIEMNCRAAEHQAEGLIHQLEQEIAELRRRSATLSQLAQSEDHILFLRSFPSLCSPLHTKDWSQISVTSDPAAGSVLRTLSQQVERFQEELRRLPEMGLRASAEHSLTRYQPKVKRVQEYAVDVTLDPSTAHPRLILSEDRKQVRCGDRHQPVPDTPDRFDRVVCVLARQGFTTGRYYWEVEVGGKTDWDLGVASQSVNRKGKITVSPAHGYWFLSLRDRNDYAFRTEPSTSLGLHLKPHKIGVYVDYEKGQVSFYNVDAKIHIYTFIDTFSDTIYPFFSPCTNKSGKNEAPLIITPVTLTD
ncbi:E3 ubiquitin-protein ligase TRIM39-like [Megalops cyprinoides]|uniref:E3 ubiquitin-protein ligase TRIM39-like n=1 Tax=Megalops cyprinoides TaxID=118141 RepID=UPI001863B217|nr:E3 ubiquitin-protein ligase TRIM39-like [Megalops cyprinoides]